MSLAISETLQEPQSHHGHSGDVRLSANSRWVNWRQYQHLLWREWRILRWWLVAAVTLTLTTMTLSAVFLTGPEGLLYRDFLVLLYTQSLIAPGTFLIGALSSSFAQDREDISFQWCTSLPVHWAQSITVKLFGACAGAVVSLVVCWVMALMLSTLFDESLRPSEAIAVDEPINARLVLFGGISSVVFTFFFVTYSVSLIGIQLCRQATNGVFLALCLSIGFLTLWYFGFREIAERYGPRGNSFAYTVVAIFGSPLICGCLFLAVASYLYRWRWYAGMYSPVAPKNFLAERQEKTLSVVDTWPLTWRVPSQQQALFWLAWRKAIQAWWWMPILVSLILLGVLMRGQSVVELYFLVPLGFLLLASFIGLGAVWSFYGERGGEAESFLAERGVSPSRHWWSHYLISTVGGTLVFLGSLFALHVLDSLIRGESILFVPESQHRPFVILLIVGAHAFTGVCLLAGQTFRRWQLAIIAVAFAVIVFCFLLGSAIATSGYVGGLLCFGLAFTGLPLSWYLSKRAAIRWQPNLDLVFPVFATIVVIGSVFMVPWVRVWVLPPSVTTLAVGRAIPSFNVPSLPAHDLEPLLSREVLFAWTDIRSLFAKTSADKLQSAANELRPKLKQCLEQAHRSSIPMHKVQDSDVINARAYFDSLGPTAFAALEIGDMETAELALKLRLKILTDLRPVSGICDLDSLQSEFLEGLERNASDEALQRLKRLLGQHPSLLSDAPESAKTLWENSMEAQASFLYRNARDLLKGKVTQVARSNDSLLESDTWLAQTKFGSWYRETARMHIDVLPFELATDLEEERFRREVSFVYRNFQRYLSSGEVAPGLFYQELELGGICFMDDLSGQVLNWDRQWKTLAVLEARMAQLPEIFENR